MRVVVFGATGNVGTATVAALEADPAVDAIVGVARRVPPGGSSSSKVSWHEADVSRSTLDVVAHADAVVHLAWKLRPSHDEVEMARTNISGTQRVIDAVVEHAVPALIVASSVGTYSSGPKQPPVDESWPSTGIPSSTYSRHKAAVERMLDDLERSHPETRVVRMRTSLVFQRAAASEVHRIFLGMAKPWALPRPLRFIPAIDRLTFQATHADDIADAYRRAVTSDAAGAFNIAADPPLDPATIADEVGGRCLPVPLGLLRGVCAATFSMHLQPTEAGWIDLATQTPVMDSTRARTELGWRPSVSPRDALGELLAGMADGAGAPTAPLHPRASLGDLVRRVRGSNHDTPGTERP